MLGLYKCSSNSVEWNPSPIVALSTSVDVPDFPRGGQSSLSRAEVDKVRAEVDKEFETKNIVLKKKKEKFKNSTRTTEDDGLLFADGNSGKIPRFANNITLKNVTPGMKLWGVISEVNEKDLVVNLPGGLRGLVRACEAIDPLLHDELKGDTEGDVLSAVYSVGQLVSCVVLQSDDDKKEKGKRRIWLSSRLALLHSSFTLDTFQEGMVINAYVKSIEDHGFMVHFGVTSFTGFMQNSNKDGSKDTKMVVGRLIQGVVKSIDKTRKVVNLSSDAKEVAKCVTNDLEGIQFNLLVPGMLVNAYVRSTLENGIMLSFLSFFNGTVDIFHLGKTLPTSKWKDEYTQKKKVSARILFIDPSTRAVGLTLNPHLVHNNAPPTLVKVGDIFDDSKVIRVDRGSGLLLEIPTTPIPTPAYVNVLDLSDKEVKKWEKNFKEGSLVRVRVSGFRLLEGLATGVLKTSAFEGSVFTHSDVIPGMVVKAKVIIVDSFGAIVHFASGVKGLCPLRHMSEFEIVKPRKKFQVGAELVFRVLGCKSKRITITHKKTLVKSKLPVLSSYTDATEGLWTHGWITKIESHGCFVRFYNGVQGFAPRAELGLDPGSDVSSMYHVEQVVKCRVTSSVPATRRINLSFLVTPARISEDKEVKLGSIVSGTIERLTANAIIVDVGVKGYIKGIISHEHLADNHGHVSVMKSLLKPGYKFEKLLVLDVENCNLILTSKYSLVNAAQQLPMDTSQVYPHSVVPGYICNIIEAGCFVRFIGRLTGFAPKNRAVDDLRADLSEVFFVGQSVRSNIQDVSSDTGRITLFLKQLLCSSTDASFIQEYFILEEKIAELHYSGLKSSSLKWVKEFPIGNVIEGTVHTTKESGVVIRFQKYNDVFGLITHHQLGGSTLDIGSTVKATILDVSKMNRLVDLSLKPELVNRYMENSGSQTPKKMRKRSAHMVLEVNQTVNTVVEIVKETYLVLSVPDAKYALGYASINDYNTQAFQPKQFVSGQRVVASVVALPDSSTAERLLLLLKSNSQAVDSSSTKRAKKKSSYDVGSAVQAEVGLCHISELPEDHIENIETKYKIREKVEAKILKIDEERERISLGMKGSYFDTDTNVGAPSIDAFDSLKEDESESDYENHSEFQELLNHPVLAEVEFRASVLPLEVPLDETEDSPMEDVSAQNPEPVDNKTETNDNKNRRTKKKEMEEREREIRAAEGRLVQEDVPRTEDDFEKLIRSSPNSSFIWIKYMAFLLSLNEADKARSMAERALRTINIREESEKVNVWVAYFNLENEYANPPEDAVIKVFQRALQVCDPKKIHFALLGMYERTNQDKLADELLEEMIKKFKHSCKVWLRRIHRVLKQNEDQVQSVVKRALICLPKHKHIKLITQTAISEFKSGVPDRGRSMFEGMLREFPKRTDLWSVYLDQEIKLGDLDVIRALFERSICLELPLKKMKFLFKKYHAFEKSQGDDERMEYVKKEAMNFIEKTRR